MATTQYFDEVIVDKKDDTKRVRLEFGRSSAYRENLLYFEIDGQHIIVNEATGRRIVEAMENLAVYLGYEFFDRK